jgi:hypothetical protein
MWYPALGHLRANGILMAAFGSGRKGYMCPWRQQASRGSQLFRHNIQYALVVTWMIVRILLILWSILGLATFQVEYTAAFVRVDVSEDVYIEIPKSFSKPGIIPKLGKSLYGLKQSPHNYFHHLRGKLPDDGFSSSATDNPCLFISDKVIALVYVDDTLFFSPKQECIDEILLKLKGKCLNPQY